MSGPHDPQDSDDSTKQWAPSPPPSSGAEQGPAPTQAFGTPQQGQALAKQIHAVRYLPVSRKASNGDSSPASSGDNRSRASRNRASGDSSNPVSRKASNGPARTSGMPVHRRRSRRPA